MMRPLSLIACAALFAVGVGPGVQAQHEVTLARVQYGGGGDWYSGDPLPTLAAFVNEATLLDVNPEPVTVELTSDALFRYPFLYLNGHGNVSLTDPEARRLRRYLDTGGFLFINDDYGLDHAIRREMRKVFPEQAFTELPAAHPVYSAHFAFPDGLPKIHEHDGARPQGLGLFSGGRLVVFYAFESDLADGWEPAHIHNDPPEVREAALRMGANLLIYAMTQGLTP